ncbi:hypothetical protein KXX44_007464, partial [Aspergillus fumigatus]
DDRGIKVGDREVVLARKDGRNIEMLKGCLHIDKQKPAVSSVDVPSLVFVFYRKAQSNINCVLVVNTLGEVAY